MLFMASYLVTIATDCHHNLPKCVSRINKQHELTANCLVKRNGENLKGVGVAPPYVRPLVSIHLSFLRLLSVSSSFKDRVINNQRLNFE